jgi:rod shape determining protein RodA
MLQQYLRRFWVRLVEHIDGPLLLIVGALMAVGLATIHSATYDANSRTLSQLLNMFIGVCVMWGVAQLPPQKLMRYAVPLYVSGIFLLVLVFFFGIRINGATRWLSLGFTRIQPSEILKIAMPLMLAWYFNKYEASLKFRHFVVAGLLLIVPFALIAKQPDLGTAILVGAAGFYVIFFAGLPWKVIFGMVAAAAGAAPFLWTMLHDYQRKRLLTLIDPTTDPLGAGYHIIQSTIAIGSGGSFGKGWLGGTQTHLEFIPERLHFCRFFGRTWPARQQHPGGALSAAYRARHDDRRQCLNAFFARHGRFDHAEFLHLRLRQYGHGQRYPAGGRCSSAVHELWRHGAGHAFPRPGHPDEHPDTSHAG